MASAELALSCVGVGVGYFTAHRLAQRLARGSDQCVWELADVLFHVPHVPLLLALVGVALSKLGGVAMMADGDSASSVRARWHVETTETRVFLALYVVQSVAHIGVLQRKRNVSSPAAYMLHHALSIACYGSALATGRMHFWAVLDALCEVTNIFLNNIFLFRALGWDRTLPTLYVLNGALLWATYVGFRLVLFPVWLWLFWRDVRGWPELTWDRINAFERYAYASTTVLLLAISTLWFGRITQGLLNAVRPSRAKRDARNGKQSGD